MDTTPTSFAFYGLLRERPGGMDHLGEYGPEAVIPGALYSAGAFPALIPGLDGERVYGRLWTPHAGSVREAARYFDRMEGVHASPPLYTRQLLDLIEPAGVRAYVYVWACPLDGMVPIPSGRWQPARLAREAA